jgi:hypothetical protein
LTDNELPLSLPVKILSLNCDLREVPGYDTFEDFSLPVAKSIAVLVCFIRGPTPVPGGAIAQRPSGKWLSARDQFRRHRAVTR